MREILIIMDRMLYELLGMYAVWVYFDYLIEYTYFIFF